MLNANRDSFRWVLGVVAVSSLAACGGGESSTEPPAPVSQAATLSGSAAVAPAPGATAAAAGSSATSSPSAPPPAATSAAPTTPPASATPAPVLSTPIAAAAAASSADTTCGLNDFQVAVLENLNRRRAAGAVCGAETFPPTASVAWNSRLTQAAYAHSLDMSTHNYFSHTSLNGATLSQRVDAQGYVWATVGENIAAGYPNVASVMQGWMDSPGHCRNMMNAQFAEIGMACSKSSASRYGSYYAINFGRGR